MNFFLSSLEISEQKPYTHRLRKPDHVSLQFIFLCSTFFSLVDFFSPVHLHVFEKKKHNRPSRIFQAQISIFVLFSSQLSCWKFTNTEHAGVYTVTVYKTIFAFIILITISIFKSTAIVFKHFELIIYAWRRWSGNCFCLCLLTWEIEFLIGFRLGNISEIVDKFNNFKKFLEKLFTYNLFINLKTCQSKQLSEV